MACLSKHGRELLRLDLLSYQKAYMADGKVLANYGHGWKQYKKVKAGLDPATVAETARKNYAAFCDVRPCYCAFKETLHRLVGREQRGVVMQTLQLLANDADGLYSELNFVELSLDDAVELSEKYERQVEEEKELKDPTNALSTT